MRSNLSPLPALFLLLAGLATHATAQPAEDKAGAPSAWNKGAMATAANPHAVDAAVAMLERGGHAVDAAIAAHAVLGLVEPQSSGLGGGAFMMVYQRENGGMTYLDGRESAPAGATMDMFMKDGAPMGFLDAWQSGKSVGVPGTVALYKLAHEKFGKLPWAEIFQPAITLAAEGFEVSPRLAGYLPQMAQITRLDDNPATAAYFYPDGEPLQAGDLRVNEDYARTLRRIAGAGAAAFYEGELAEAIAAAAQAGPDGGTMTVEDIAGYRAVEREPVCGEFLAKRACSAAPPSSGAALIMMAQLYERLARDAGSRIEEVAAFVDAQRLAYADRDHYFGDPDFIEIPLDSLMHPDYLDHRAEDRFAPDAAPTHGDPALVLGREAVAWAADTTEEAAGTTHLSIVDAEGNAVSMTASVESAFGSSRWAGGFLLNNELTDFSRAAAPDGSRSANAVAPGARPRSSMSPTIVLDADGDLFMVTGSPGGNSILAYNFKSIIGVVDWDMTAQEIVDFPNIIARGRQVRVETNVAPGQELARDLARLGYRVDERDGENSGLHVIVVREEGLSGAADKRREGTVGILP